MEIQPGTRHRAQGTRLCRLLKMLFLVPRAPCPVPWSFSLSSIMLYRFARILMWVTFRTFFRRIRVVGSEKLSNKPAAILIANHPGSFLDAMVLAVFLKRPIHFFVRGDIFHHPTANRILRILHMVPIFSKEHGTHNLSRNKDTFNEGRGVLKDNKLLLIFPEGFSRFSKALAPFKKGASRVALQTAFEDGHEHLTVESIAINYSYHGFRCDLFIRVGESFSLDPYKELYLEQPNHAVTQLNGALQQVFERNVIHIKQGERTLYTEDLMRMLFADLHYQGNLFFEQCRALCERISNLSEETWQDRTLSLAQYKRELVTDKLHDADLADERKPLILLAFTILLLPVAALGALVWALPVFFVKWIADKTVTREDFYTSVFNGVLGVFGFIWWLIWTISFLIAGKYMLMLYIMVSPLFLILGLFWKDKLVEFLGWLQVQRLKRSAPQRLEALRKLRAEIQ